MSEVEKAKRAMYWSEMSDNIKIEELKKKLQRIQRQVKDLCGYVKTLLQHEHSSGRIVYSITINSLKRNVGAFSLECINLNKLREDICLD